MAGHTTILEEREDKFDSVTGEVTSSTKRTVQKKKVDVTDEFFKVSKYLNLIYSYNDIPLNLVPISLIFAQRMEFKTNVLYLLKGDKEEIGVMLGIGVEAVKKLIIRCRQHDIIRPTTSRGKYEVNSFLFSTGSMVETRGLQAQFDIESDTYMAQADQKNLITGETVRKSIINKERSISKGQTPGQMSLTDLIYDEQEEE
ncbi:MAG: hypothetical protein ACK5KP_04570 [Paludibacteraceae bacterium]